MTSELRPEFDIAAYISTACGAKHVTPRAIAIIKADREAVRAEQAAELAKFKALAETLAGALEDHLPSIVKRSTLLPGEKGNAVQLEVNLYKIADRAAALSEALRKYKEARDV